MNQKPLSDSAELSAAMIKRFLLVFIPVALLLTLVFYLFYQFEISNELRVLKFSEENQVRLAQKRVEPMLNEVASEVLVQAQRHIFLTWPKQPSKDNLSALGYEFASLMANKGVYDQVRFLNLHGKEVVRVNFPQGWPLMVPESELQEKSGRYYFRDAIGLAPEEVYFSPFDLNVEQGKIEIPLKPTIRFATPVYNAERKKIGLVVINYLGSRILKALQEQAVGAGRVLLIDGQGYWLLGLNPQDEWGFMYPDKKDRRFDLEFPLAWSEIARRDQGQFFTEKGLFTFCTLTVQAVKSRGPSWKIVSYVANPAVDAAVGVYLHEFIYLWAGLILLAAGASGTLARTQIKRRHAMESLADSEARNRSILLTAADGIIAVDEKGAMQRFNPAAEKIFGYQAQEVMGRDVLMLFAESRRMRMHGILEQYFRDGGVPGQHEIQESLGLRKNGKEFPLEIAVSIARGGLRTLLIGIVRDITERKRAEEQIAKSAENQEVLNQLLRLSLQSGSLEKHLERALYVIFATSWLRTLPKGGIFLVKTEDPQSLHLVAQHGLEPAILTMCARVPFGRCHCGKAGSQKTIQYSSHVDERHENTYAGMAAHGHYNVPITRGDRCLGVLVLYLPEGQVRREEEVGFLEAVGHTLASLIESRLAADAVQESEARLRAIVDHAVEGIITCNTAGIIQSFNPAAEKIFGYAAAEVIGQNVVILQPEPFRSQHDTFIQNYLKTQTRKVIGTGREVTGRKKDGSEVPLYLSLSEVNLADRIVFTGILRDISEIKRAQTQLQDAKDEAEAANQELMAKQKHLAEDLRAAAEIQKTLLPHDLPKLPEVELAWKFLPSEFVGGDIFNCFMLDSDHMALYMLDVSGHGVPSALITVSVHEMLDRQIRHENQAATLNDDKNMQPGRVLEILDREYPLERFGKSFTIVYLILNIKTGRVLYSNAGHPPPLVVGQDSGIQVLERGGTLIGLGGVLPFENGEVVLRPGDKIFLYTDGVVEYENPDGAFWGEKRFRQLLSEKCQLPVPQILEKVWEALATFGVGESPKDDVSLIGLEFKGKANGLG